MRARRLVALGVLTLGVALPVLLLARLALALAPLSVIDDVGNAILGAVGGAVGEVVDLARKVWGAFKRIWSFLSDVAAVLDGAWTWVTNGAKYIGVGLERLAEQSGHLLWGIVSQDLPEGLQWVYAHSVEWALSELESLGRRVGHWIGQVVKWAQRELKRLEHLLLGWVHHLIHWASDAVHWVAHFGAVVWHYISHPAALAELLADHIVWPVVKWFLHEGASVISYLLKLAAHESSEVEHLVEDVLSDLL